MDAGGTSDAASDRGSLERLRGVVRRRPADATAAACLLASVLLAWNAALLYADPAVAGLLFLLGPFAGLGIALACWFDVEESLATLAFLGLVDAIVAVTVLGAVARFTALLPLTTGGLVAGFDLLYLAVLGHLWVREPERLAAVPIPRAARRDLVLAAASLAVALVALLAFETKRTTGDSLPVVLAYLWLLVAFAALFLRAPDDGTAHALFLATAGLVLAWSQSVPTYGLFAVDGLETTRFVRATLSGLDVEVFDPRLYYSLTGSGFFPGLSLLSTLSPTAVAKYVLPAIAGLSLVGVYRLTRTWLDARASFAAAFLLSFQYPFALELVTLYRSAVAFPVLVAVYLFLVREYRPRRTATTLLYLGAVLVLHDTVGVYLLAVLGVTFAVALAVRRWTSREIRLRGIASLFGLAGLCGAIFFVRYRDAGIWGLLSRGLVLVAGYLPGVDVGGQAHRTVLTTLASLAEYETVVAILRQLGVLSTVGLMAAGTAILLAGLVWGERVTGALDWHHGDAFTEALLVANAAWFGLLVAQPVMGPTRVFLYASPLLVGLFVFAVRQVDVLVRRHGSIAPLQRGPSAAAIALVALLAFGFVTQTGLVVLAAGGTVPYPSFGDHSAVDLRYEHAEDVRANQWLVSQPSTGYTIHVDKLSYALLLDDPEIAHARLDQILVHEDLDRATSDGCLLLRTANVRSGRLLLNTGRGGHAVPVEYPPALLESRSTAYTAGSARIVC